MWLGIFFFCLLTALCMLSFSAVVVSLGQMTRGNFLMHFCVGVTFLPIAGILAYLLPSGYNSGLETLKQMTKQASGLTWLQLLPTLDDQPSLMDAQAIACLLLCDYGFMVIGSHLVTLTRYLKASRRRMICHQRRKQ